MHVPCYEGLTVKDILQHGAQSEAVRAHLPDDRDIRRLPRQWIVNIIFSLTGDSFREWVSTMIHRRNDNVALKHDLMIELDPEIARAFTNSVNISSEYTLYPLSVHHSNNMCHCISYQGSRRAHS